MKDANENVHTLSFRVHKENEIPLKLHVLASGKTMHDWLREAANFTLEAQGAPVVLTDPLKSEGT